MMLHVPSSVTAQPNKESPDAFMRPMTQSEGRRPGELCLLAGPPCVDSEVLSPASVASGGGLDSFSWENGVNLKGFSGVSVLNAVEPWAQEPTKGHFPGRELIHGLTI